MRRDSRKVPGASSVADDPTVDSSVRLSTGFEYQAERESSDGEPSVAALIYPEPAQVTRQIHRIAQRITAGLSLEDALGEVLRAVEVLLGASGASVFLLEESGNVVNRRYTTHGTGRPHWESRPGRINPDGITMRVLHSGLPIIVEDAQTD